MIRRERGIGLNIPAWTGCSLTGVLILACLSFLATTQLAGCSAPKRAPVVSREEGGGRSATPSRNRTGSYRVRRGDTLIAISWRYGLDHRRLAAWNSIRPPYTIYPGQKLRLSPPPKSYASARKSTVTKSQKASKSVKPATKSATGSRTASQGTKRTVKGTDALKLNWRWPTKGTVIQGFRRGDPGRKGVKIGGKRNQPVLASEAGRVVYSGSGLIGYGRLIIIKHNKNYLSAYGYNEKILVKEGDQVKRGERIAQMGSNGTGKARLHFEIRRNGAPVDPLALLPRRR
ncbi:MAG: peptidoglycan DD-metalloendopeptidase family protein [Sedimenticola sp.]